MVFEKIHELGATKAAPLMEIVNKLIDTEEALVNQFDSDAKHEAGTSGVARDSSSKFRKTFRGARSRWTLTFDVQRRGVQRGAWQPLHVP
jgi:hypothetical protein